MIQQESRTAASLTTRAKEILCNSWVLGGSKRRYGQHRRHHRCDRQGNAISRRRRQEERVVKAVVVRTVKACRRPDGSYNSLRRERRGQSSKGKETDREGPASSAAVGARTRDKKF